MDVRQALEIGLIGGAIEKTTPRQLAAVEDSVCRMEALARAGGHFMEAGAEFHRRLFGSLENELLISLLGLFWTVCRRIHAELGGTDTVDLVEDAAIHRGIYGTAAAADTALAAARLNSHFGGMRRRILRAVSS